MKVLVIEDNHKLRDKIKRILELEGYQTYTAKNMDEARVVFKQQKTSLMLVDIMLPDGNGYDLIKTFKQDFRNWVIIISALDDTDSKRICYQYGADDYITKPFGLDEFIYKMNAFRNRFRNEAQRVRIGDVWIDETKETISTDKGSLTVPYRQIRFLRLLYQRRMVDDYVKKEEVVDSFLEDVDDSNRIQTFVHRVRKNLEYIKSDCVRIETVYGKGYKLCIVNGRRISHED